MYLCCCCWWCSYTSQALAIAGTTVIPSFTLSLTHALVCVCLCVCVCVNVCMCVCMCIVSLLLTHKLAFFCQDLEFRKNTLFLCCHISIIFVLVACQVFMQKPSAQLTTFKRNKMFLITFDILQYDVYYVPL
jgi:hypothetical protein